MNQLAEKSKGLKKVMQPRMAYKYAPREQSSSDLLSMNAQSLYAFSGRKDSNMGRSDAIHLYNRRSKSIANNGGPLSPAAGPSSGTGAQFMTNDTSAQQLKDTNEVVVVANGSQPSPAPVHEEHPTQEAEEQ